MQCVYNIFGSKTSTDVDIMVVVKEPLSTQDSHEKVHELDRTLGIYEEEIFGKNRKVNTNLCTIDNNKNIQWVFKGTPDECQNSIIRTYSNHKQKYPCICENIVPRNIPIKITRSIRSVLSTMTRTEGNRAKVKQALRANTIKDRLECLESLDISTLVYMANCKENPIELYKQIAFQIGQTIALIEDNEEIYDKEEIGAKYPKLIPSLRRCNPTEYSIKDLESMKKVFTYAIRKYMEKYPHIASYSEVGFCSK